ncbi:unnamed protein product [Brassica rapa]|uniref:Uncharacterized protein n=1 Tax=Brassica campestris TaxID=3711 RepID=A0A3P6BPF9_BRACM|nr:unnamed protein product [Brassica rapa]VDC98071.1 unnamed protein product [Brassica rapa]
MLGEMVEKPEKADRFEGSDVRPARERAYRRRSLSIFHRVIFYGFSYLSSPYRLVGALVRAVSFVITSGGDPSPVEALSLEQRRERVEVGVTYLLSLRLMLSDFRNSVLRALAVMMLWSFELGCVPVDRSWEMAPGFRLLRVSGVDQGG